MGSNAKKKTTMAKLNRERRLRERRFEKQAKKDARKRAAAEGTDIPPFALEDLVLTAPDDVPDRSLDCTWWDVVTAQPTQARVRVPASQSQDAEKVLDALNRETSKYGREVVEGRMLSVTGHELLVGYDDAQRPRGAGAAGAPRAQ